MFGYWVKDPERYGVVEFDASGQVLDIEEKPRKPRSNFAVPGLYFYDNDVVDIAAKLARPPGESWRSPTSTGPICSGGSCGWRSWAGASPGWTPAPTNRSWQASTSLRPSEKRQGLKIACIEEIAYRQGFIDAKQLKRPPTWKNGYGQYLMDIANEDGQPL